MKHFTKLMNGLFLVALLSVPAFAAKAPWKKGGVSFVRNIRSIEVGESVVVIKVD